MTAHGGGAAAPCPICGGAAFGPGPKGRTAPGGAPPRCLGCGSLERHRAQRVVLEAIRDVACGGRRALQFSPDPAVDPEWFAAFELSVYGTPSGLDLAAIDRPDGSVDAVVCNHVLEHVGDDRAALAEIARILAPDGWLFLSVPDPVRMSATREYGTARADKHGHWRVYGPDVVERIAGAMPDFAVLSITARDPVTAAQDRSYLAARDGGLAAEAAARVVAAGAAASERAPAVR